MDAEGCCRAVLVLAGLQVASSLGSSSPPSKHHSSDSLRYCILSANFSCCLYHIIPWGLDRMADILQMAFSNEYPEVKNTAMSFDSNFTVCSRNNVELTISRHSFRMWLSQGSFCVLAQPMTGSLCKICWSSAPGWQWRGWTGNIKYLQVLQDWQYFVKTL